MTNTNRPVFSLKTHNILDYVVGAVLVLCPYLFGFDAIDPARNSFMILGLGLITYSLFTRYEYSIAKIIPLGVHMTMDVIVGVALILAPYLFGYRDALTGTQMAVHVILGIGAVALVAFTRPRTEARGALDSDVTDIRRAA